MSKPQTRGSIVEDREIAVLLTIRLQATPRAR